MMFLQTVRSLALTGVLVSACGSDGGDGNGDDQPAGNQPTGKIEIFPSQLYSGFDGTNTYRVPIVVNNAAGQVTWTISDPSMATLQPSGAKGDLLTITTKKAGQARISAKVGNATADVPLTINAYTIAQYQAGKQRYENNRDADNPACISCHSGSADHSPSEIGRDPDEDLITIILTGVDPENNPEEPARIADRTEFRDVLRGKTHEWKVTEAEKKGLVAYMRSLSPRGRPALDSDDD